MRDKKSAILIVEDDEQVRTLLARNLIRKCRCLTACTAEEATQLLETAGPFDAVFTDITMPGASGLDLCRLIHEKYPETVVVMVSGQTEINYAIEAMQIGAFDYVTKPFTFARLSASVERALGYHAVMAAKKQYERALERTVRESAIELGAVSGHLNQTLEVLYINYRATLRALATALEARDVETRGHSDRVVAYCLRLGKELGLTHSELITLEQGALLHDIGKIGVRDSILFKTGPLTEDEWVEMREHVNHGLSIIDRIDFLSGARPVVAQHHEKYDGSGYPARLRGESIHINARIFAVADALDAITSDRPYRRARSYDDARAEIVRNAGGHFDPMVVAAYLDISKNDWEETRRAAESHDYIEHIIDRRELQTFVVSLKHPGASGRQHAPAAIR